MTRRALICGVSGQDGAYLARFLLGQGYEVHGTSRDAHLNPFTNLQRLGIAGQVRCTSTALNDFRSVLQTINQVQPDEIYNLSGQTSVGLSFEQPVETMESISVATLNLLEAIRFAGSRAKFYNSGSGECFGETGERAADEETPFRPRSPYAVAKAAAHWQVANYREAYDLFACTGILFNHESPLRPPRFVTRKIVQAACRIAQGGREKLHVGRTDVMRDWGWAPEYVEAMWRIMQNQAPADFVIATGESHTLAEFIEAAFAYFELKWRDHVVMDSQLVRPADIRVGRANPAKAATVLGWRAQFKMADVVRQMIEAETGNAQLQTEAANASD